MQLSIHQAIRPTLATLALATLTLAMGALTLAATIAPSPSQAQDFTLSGVEDMVSDARRTVRDIDDESRSFRRNLEDAVGIMIYPTIIKAGFIFAIEGGAGMLLSRYEDLRDPPVSYPIDFEFDWSAPAFFNLAAGSVGFQIGASGSQVIFLFMNDRAFERAMDGDFELGADVNVTIVNQDAREDTVFESANVLSYALAGGLFAGIAFEGANIDSSREANNLYYDGRPRTEEIVSDPFITNDQADRLRALLTELGQRE